jgi:hypothetical protein
MFNRYDGSGSPHPPEFARRQLTAETIFDGTKLPLVVEQSQNHHGWYEVAALFVSSEKLNRHRNLISA